METIEYKRVDTDTELQQLLKLQKSTIKSALSELEKERQGFLTISHSFEILKKMNDACPHIIAKSNNRLAGYALVMLPSFRNEIAVLQPMFATADILLGKKNYLVMGQVCVAKGFRGKGIFREMYAYYKNELQNDYDCLFTEIATANKRSLKAHQAVGFEILKTQKIDGVSWEMVNWDWS